MKSPYQRAKDLLDSVLSVFVRTRGARRTGGICEICGIRTIEVCFHFIPRGKMPTRFEPDNCCASCSPCNAGEMWNRGRTDKYRQAHIRLKGEKRVLELEALSKQPFKKSAAELVEMKRALEAKMAKGEYE